MGVRIEAPKQDGNARFNTLKVNLNENNLATRVVVVDEQGNFYYGAGGAGTAGTNGSSGTSGANGSSGTSGANGTSGTDGSSGSSGTSGTGFNTIADPLQGRVLLSDGSTNNASASANLFYDTGSSIFQITGSIVSTQGLTGSLEGTSSWAISASYAPNIYNSDGDLTSNRFLSSSLGYFLRFDSYLGIYTDPSYRFDVSGTARVSSLVINTSGQNRTISTFYGANSTGANIYIGGGGNSSVGEVGQTFKGSNNISLGVLSLYLNSTGYNNSSVGNYSLYLNTVGNSNSAFGYFALRNNTSGSFNTAMGVESLWNNTIGNRNVGVGMSTLLRNTVGGDNTSLGFNSMYYNTSGSFNTAVGSTALNQNTLGSENTAIGYYALLANTTGSLNVAIGNRAGQFNTSGSNNIFIGASSTGLSPSASNGTWIGNNDTITTWLAGNLLLGTTINAGYKADIFGSLRVTSSVLFPGLTQSPQTNVVLINSSTGQLYYTASSAIIPSTAASASFVSSSNVYGPYGFNSIQTASYALTASSADDFTVRGTLTAQTIVAQVITSSTDYVTGSTIFGSQLSNTHEFTGSVFITGSLEVNDSLVVLSNQTGSMSVATSSYAFTASYVDSSNVDNLFRIATGSVSASVNVTPESLFLINSGFTQYFNISSSGDVDIYSNLFIVRNFNTQQPVLIVSQSIVQIATQSFDPTGITQPGTIWFTSASMFVGLE
jgi:hypothetical protein